MYAIMAKYHTGLPWKDQRVKTKGITQHKQDKNVLIIMDTPAVYPSSMVAIDQYLVVTVSTATCVYK